MIRKPSRNAYLGTFATSLFIQGCTVVQGVFLARMLGPAGRGEFATALLWPQIFAGFGIFGVNMAIARFSGQGKNTGDLVKTAIVSALLTGILSTIACGLALPVLIPEAKHHLLSVAYLFLFFVPINHLALNLQGIDQGSGNFVCFNGTRAILYPIYFVGLILCWLFAEDKVFWAVAALVLANASVVVLRLFLNRQHFRNKDNYLEPKALLRESYPFVAASIIALFYMQMDKALLVWLLPPEEIGWYVAAFAAAGSVNVLNSALGVVQFSAAAQAVAGHGFPALATSLRRGGMLSFLGGGLLAAMLPWLIPLVYGPEFYPATFIGLLLLPGLILAGLGEIVNQALCGQGHPVAGVVSKVLGLLVIGLLGIMLAREWGGKGIACGYLGGEIVAFSGLLFVTMRYYKDAAWSELIPRKEDLMELLVVARSKINNSL